MGSDHDTEDYDPSRPREKTDPAFPGPISRPGPTGTDPGFPPPSEEVPAAAPVAAGPSPHDIRVSDTLPAAPKKSDAPGPMPQAAPVAAGAPSNPPPRMSSQPPPARSESIDELLDGLAGEGHLPRKPKGPVVVVSAPPRTPAPPTATPDALPPVLLGPELEASVPPAPRGLRDNETVLTPEVLARRTRPGTVVAGALGIAIAVVLLALVRVFTRGPDPVEPAAPVASATSATTVTTLSATAQAPRASAAPAPIDPPPPTETVPSGTAESVPSKSARPRSSAESSPSVRIPTPAPADSSLDEFRKTIRR